MARTPSTMLALGTTAPDFSLPEPKTDKIVSRHDFQGRPLLVMFICNHCPYVIHIRSALAQLTAEFQAQGVGVVGINANDAEAYPDDSPEQMQLEVEQVGYTFPYLYDATQAVAKAYQAACTPDFFLFDAEHRLVYRGQFDNARPRNEEPVTGADLRHALEAVVQQQPVTTEQKASLGCNIKWKAGNEPDYFTR
ncbi:thioredoxin family protein [Thiofilum flexile]|uniref:thioredoxin family protein n=1 Tax=Thiofilum flexile TaxID=125627 RepID=UPI00037162FD|nr:thioredoxin family protein [Thiofilum flexile]